MNVELMIKIGKLIDYACGWRKSFYRRYPNKHHTPMIKYFDFRIDTRDMNAWLISLDTHMGQQSFRLDEENFGLLVSFLDLPKSDEMDVYLGKYRTDEEFGIYNYQFTVYKDEEGFYFITADEDIDKLLEDYIREMRYAYPDLEMELVKATCEQAVREGVRDVAIVWEWLQDEI